MRHQLSTSVRIWGMACHLSGLPSVLLGLFPPFFYLLIPLVVWLIGRDQHPFVDDQGRSLLNFQISMNIYGTVLALLGILLFFSICSVGLMNIHSNSSMIDNTLNILAMLFSLIWLGLIVFQFVCILFATHKAWQGETYRYPFSLTFLQ